MEYVVAARIAQLQVVDPGEIRHVQLALPDCVEIGGVRYPLHDTMRPGTAFLAKPWGMRTDKCRRRMYTRSNSSCNEPGLLETFINHTHRPQADTSIWWQSEEADHWKETGKTLDIRVTVDEGRGVAWVSPPVSPSKPLTTPTPTYPTTLCCSVPYSAYPACILSVIGHVCAWYGGGIQLYTPYISASLGLGTEF